MKITRRKLAAAVAAPAVMLGQAPSPPIPTNREEELAAMREQNRRNGEVLDKVKVPMSAEPAFIFKV
jgi:hypothetical protein